MQRLRDCASKSYVRYAGKVKELNNSDRCYEFFFRNGSHSHTAIPSEVALMYS